MTALTSLLVTVAVGQSSSPGVSANVTFLKSLKPGLTLGQVKAKLPSGTTVSKPVFVPPVDGRLTGSVVTLSGKLNGTVSFLRSSQLKALQGSGGSLLKNHLSTDPIHGVQLTLESSKSYSKATGERLLAALTKSLGKPSQRATFEPEWMNDFGGWSARWKVNGKAAEFYEYQGDRYESRLLMILGEKIYP